jgi:putative hemolysin
MKWSERRWQPKLAGGGKEAAEIQELRAATSLARMSRLIGKQEERIILGAARLSSRPVREIMLPADDIRLLSIESSLEEALVAAHIDMHTRFPVTERPGDPQRIVGYVSFKDIVAHRRLAPQNPSLRAIARAIPSFPDHLPIADCLEQLIANYNHIALLRNAAGQVVGMITVEDIIEELVGDIRDEYDRLPTHIVPAGPAWVIGGGVTLERLKRATSIDLTQDLPPGGAATLNEWITRHAGGELRGGEVIERGGLRVVVRKVRRGMPLESHLLQRKD